VFLCAALLLVVLCHAMRCCTRDMVRRAETENPFPSTTLQCGFSGARLHGKYQYEYFWESEIWRWYRGLATGAHPRQCSSMITYRMIGREQNDRVITAQS